MSTTSLAQLRAAFAAARAARGVRHRDLAAELGVSEGELIAAHAGLFEAAESPLKATRLQHRWPELIAAAESLGDVTALTRNDSCVHEKVGTYRDCSVNGTVGLVLGGAIDLRVFYACWAHGFAVQEQTAQGPQRSLQFYDAQGTAVHKIFLREREPDAPSVQAWERLVADFRAAGTTPGITVVPEVRTPPERPDAEVDQAGFRSAWSSMRDTHEFFGLLKRHGLSRTQALRLAAPEFAQAVDPGTAQEVLQRASQTGTPIMVFVGNPGMIQIHSGPVNRVEVRGPWLNVLDPGFNLHLREDHIASAWRVRKPTSDGLVSSLELFDAQGRTIAMFFGERKPGQAERCDWRELLEGMTPEDARCPA
jgi:putative hemin transport protein